MAALKLPTKRRKYHQIMKPDAGLVYDTPTTMIEEHYTPNCEEVCFREGVIEKIEGTTYFGGGTATPAAATTGIAGDIMHIDQFYKSDASAGVLICHTNATGSASAIYSYNSTTKVFGAVSGTTGFTGDLDYFWTSETMNDLYIFTNNKEALKKWTGSGAIAPLVSGTGAAAGYFAQKILKYGERLCLFRTTEGGTLYPQRVHWSAAGDPTDFTSTGTGYSDLKTSLGVDFIITAEKLADYVAIYAERTILLMEYKGDVNDPFNFAARVTGIGLAAPRALVNMGEEHIFLGWDDVYSYKGGRDVERVATGLREELFRVINPEYIHRSFIVYIEEEEEILLFIPTAGSEIPDTYFRISMKNKSWSRGTRSYLSFGYFETKTSRTWDEMTHSWDSDLTRWNDSTLQALAPLNLFGKQNGIIIQNDTTTNNLADGTAINGYWETKDFVVGAEYERNITNWMELNFEAKGNTVIVYYSTDFGETWSSGKSFTLDASDWTLYNYDFEVNSPQIRFRFRNATASETFKLRMFEIGYLEASDRGVR